MEGQRTQSGRGRRTTTVNQPDGTQNSNILNVGTKSAKAVTGWINSHRWMTFLLLLLLLFFLPLPRSCEREESTPDSSPPLAPSTRPIVVPPTVDHHPVEAEKEAKEKKKEVVINVSPDTIMQWMLERIASPEGGWTLMERTCTQAVNRQGYLPLPVGPILPGTTIEVELGGRRLPALPGWQVVNQYGNHALWAHEEGETTEDTVALFLEVRGFPAMLPQPLLGEDVRFPGLTCTATVTPSSNSTLWVGLHGSFPQLSLQRPGMVPMRINGEAVTWTMRVTFIPFTPVTSGAQELKETASPPGFYDIQQPKLWLLPDVSVIENPEKAREELDSKAIFGKVMKPRFLDRDSPTRDSFEITSDEVRRSWKKEAETAAVYVQPAMDSLIYWEIFFPVSTED